MYKKPYRIALKWVLYSLIVVFALLVQTIPLGQVQVLGVHLNLVPVAIACVAMRCGAVHGGLFALGASTFWCLSGADFGSLSILTLTVCGIVAGGVCTALLTRTLVPAGLLSLMTLAVSAGAVFAVRLYVGQAAPWQAVTVLLPEVGLSLVTYPVFFVAAWGAERAGG